MYPSTVWGFTIRSSGPDFQSLVTATESPRIKFGWHVSKFPMFSPNLNKFTQAAAPVSNLANVFPPATSESTVHPIPHMARSRFIVDSNIFQFGSTTDKDEASP